MGASLPKCCKDRKVVWEHRVRTLKADKANLTAQRDNARKEAAKYRKQLRDLGEEA